MFLKMFSAVLVLVMSQSLSASVFEQDARYVYQVTPYTEAMKSTEDAELVLKTSVGIFQNYLQSLGEKGLVPTEILNFDDLKKVTESEKGIENAINTLNAWIKKVKAKSPVELSGLELLPDAFLVFGGGKMSANLGIGGGGSINIGAVIMPVWIKKIEKVSGLVVDEYLTARTAIVGWASPDIGKGLGGGLRGRLGMGFLWNFNREFVAPEQFKGFGIGASQSTVIGPIGYNLKLGVLNSLEMSDYVDFVYATVGWEMGLAATAELHANATAILPASVFLQALDSTSQKIMQEQSKELQKQLEEALKEMTRSTPETKDEPEIVQPRI